VVSGGRNKHVYFIFAHLTITSNQKDSYRCRLHRFHDSVRRYQSFTDRRFSPIFSSWTCKCSTLSTSIVGKALYLQFKTVVCLRQQRQVTDTKWINILDRSWEGACFKEDVVDIQKLVLMEPSCEVPNFDEEP